MIRTLACACLTAVLAIVAFGQTTEPPTAFEIADIHTSPRSNTTVMRTSTRPGRYELHNATMLDLIRTAYSFDADKIVGGPNWLEYDRFDVIAKTPPKAPDNDTLKLMLQALLADRFKLVVHKDTQGLTGLVLTMGKGKHKLKESDGKGETGCKPQPQTSTPVQISGAGVLNVPMISVSCRNVTMEAFAAALKGLAATDVPNVVVDSTGLKGSWDFDLKWAQRFVIQILGAADVVTLPDAIDKQLGLKLEEQKVPTPVLVVDKVNEKPTDNPDAATKLPPPPPVEFEVVDIKPSAPLTAANIQSLSESLGRTGFFPGGRVNLPRFSLRTAALYAWNLVSQDDIVGAPIPTTSFDIVAKAPPEVSPVNGNAPLQDLGPMLQAMLIDRFKMKAHFEDRPVNAYTLVAAKPKLKKADPANRTGCKTANAPNAAGSTPFGILTTGRVVTCQNITMNQFAEQLLVFAQTYVHYPVLNSTGLEGAWDFTFTYSSIPPAQLAGLRGSPPVSDAPQASDPVGGTTLFDAVEKQLGLKLEMQKRPLPVLVVDHIEQSPTDN